MKVKVKDQLLDEINALNIFKNHENKGFSFFSEFKMSTYIRGIEEAIVELAKERKLEDQYIHMLARSYSNWYSCACDR